MKSIRVAIVGAGIAGLTAAIALHRIGIPARVYERADHLREVGAGIQLSPNGTRILHDLGLGPALDRVSVRPEFIEVRRWENDAPLARTRLGDDCEAMYGAPYLVLHRAELHRTLLDHVPDDTVRLGMACEGLERGPDGGTVLRFADGSSVTADLVIGADGIRSTMRDHLLCDEPRFSGHTVFRGVVDADRVPHSAVWPRVQIRMGPEQHCVSYPISSGRQVSFAATAPADDRWSTEAWDAPGDVDELLRAYQGWSTELRAMLAAATSVTRWMLFDRPAVSQWTNHSLALVGDAAHPMLPFGAQGASQAIEDIAVLAAALRDGTDDVPGALHRYESVRRPRTRRVQEFIQDNEKDHHVADGEEQRTRDAESGQDWGLRQRAWLFGYHAEKEVTGS